MDTRTCYQPYLHSNDNSFQVGSKKRELFVKLNRIDVFKCDRCPRVFPNTLLLAKHISHHVELFHKHMLSAYVSVGRSKIYSCKHCRQSFLTKRECVFHGLKHVQQNMIVARSKERNPNNTHIEKPYKCPNCEYAFAAEVNLEAHLVLHKPYPHICECGVGYYRKQDLLTHISIMHRPKGRKSWKRTINYKATFENEMETKPETQPRRTGPKLKAELMFKCPLKKKTTSNPVATFSDKLNSIKSKMKYPKGTKPIKKSSPIKLNHPDIDIKLSADRKFICPICKKHIASKACLYTHYRTHTGERPYECEICDARFSQSAGLSTHVNNVHIGKRLFACSSCPKSFKNSFSRTLHERTHTGEKPHECSLCGKAFSDPSAFIRHERTHTGDMRYKCPYCPKAFTDASGLIMHRKRHNKETKFSCEQCDKKFYDRASMNNHIKSVHTNEKSFCCDYCGKYFALKQYLVFHIENVHLKKVKYVCKHCSRSFRTWDGHKNHLAHEHNEYEKMVKKFECDYCSLKFFFKRKLSAHIMKAHNRVRCRGCHQMFPSRSKLNEHKSVERCVICEKALVCKTMWSKHMRNHVAVIKQDCGVCGGVFDEQGALERHLASPTAHAHMPHIMNGEKHETSSSNDLKCLNNIKIEIPIEE